MLNPISFPLHEIVDTDGRPLREQAASPAASGFAPHKLAVCRYPGSRYLHKNRMNVSALRQLNEHWDDVLHGFSLLRDIYPVSTKITYIDLWRIGFLAEVLPEYVVYRRLEPLAATRMPPVAAAMYKIAIGMNAAILQFAQTRLFEDPEHANRSIELEKLYDFIETSRALVGKREVCAGPEQMIRKVFHILSGEAPRARPEGPLLEAVRGTDAFKEFAVCRMDAQILSDLSTEIIRIFFKRLRDRLVLARPELGGMIPTAKPSPLQGASNEMLSFVARTVLSFAYGPTYEGSTSVRSHADLLVAALTSPEATAQEREYVAEALQTRGCVDDGFAQEIISYLSFEKSMYLVAFALKSSVLGTLGYEPASSSLLQAQCHAFSPPDPCCRSLLASTLGLHLDENMRLTHEDRPAIWLIGSTPAPEFFITEAVT